MSDSEFKEYLQSYWPFLSHGDDFWGRPGEPIEISSMDKKHLENSIKMIKRWEVKLPEDSEDIRHLEELKQNKLNELEIELERK